MHINDQIYCGVDYLLLCFSGHLLSVYPKRVGWQFLHGVLKYLCKHTESRPYAEEPGINSNTPTWTTEPGRAVQLNPSMYTVHLKLCPLYIQHSQYLQFDI